MEETTHYLGDGVYVKIDNGSVVLMANDDKNPTDTIFLEQEVIRSFLGYLLKNNVIREFKNV